MEYILKNDKLQVVFSSHGGEMISIKSLENGREYLWQGNGEFWTGRAPNLFPIVGRVKEGKYTFDGVEYQIKSPHGFVRQSELELAEKTADSIVFRLKSNEETRASYPFDFDYYVSYTLSGSTVTVSYFVLNQTNEPMYFSLGAHPGFNLPFEADEKFEDCRIEFGGDVAPKEMLCDNCFITGKTRDFSVKDKRIIPLRHDLFDNDAFILSDLANHVITLCSEKSEKSVTVDFTQFKYVAIWHKPFSEAPMVCIEPWNGLPSYSTGAEELTEKPAIVTLAPDETYRAEYSITIK